MMISPIGKVLALFAVLFVLVFPQGAFCGGIARRI